MQLVWIVVIGIVAAGVVSLFTPLAIKAGRALQWKTQPDMMRACQREPLFRRAEQEAREQ